MDHEITSLVRAFEDTSLPKEGWTHGAHITVALHYVSMLDESAALETMRARIQRFNASKGGLPSAYHETITRAWLAVLRLFFRANGGTAEAALFGMALARFDKDYLFRFYTRDRLLSDEARAGWVPPDRAPFHAQDPAQENA
jgi:hypothetical protein